MRNVARQARIDLNSGPIDHIAVWLDRRTYAQATGLVLFSAIIVAGLDFSTAQFELCIATLYIVPVCLACWMFERRESVATAALVTFIACTKYPVLHSHPSLFTTIYNGTSRALAFATLTAIMVAFRRSYDCARTAATRDPMTGALNKEAFHLQARVMLDMAEETGRTVLLVYLDLDGFKAVNDQNGHHVGDEVLQAFSAGASRTLRRTDCFGRVGGDEFAVGTMVSSEHEAQQRAESLHRRFSTTLAASGQAVNGGAKSGHVAE